MAKADIIEKYIPNANAFYRDNYRYFLYGLIALLFLALITMGVTARLLQQRPLPTFFAKQDGKQMQLFPSVEPNLLPDTIIRFASKAAVAAYTYDFARVNEQLQQVRPYFTDAGWAAFYTQAQSSINRVVANRLFVNGVVVGTPVISHQGELPDIGYAWRVEIPFLITYSSSEVTTKFRHIIAITLVRVPTSINPQGIGIYQFITA
jgi:intracellular multiplication protein IcmL